jgi:cobalt/nickel transport system permease protein
MSEIYLIDYYSNTIQSILHRLAPQTKVIFLLLVLFSIILSKSILILFLILWLIIFLILVAKLPLLKILKWSLYPAFFALLFIISQIQYGFLPFITLFRAIDAALCLLLIFCTTPYPTIFSLFSKISRPLANLFFLTYHYFFLIIDEIQIKLKVMKIRGGYAAPSKILKNLAFVIGHFLIHSLEKSKRLYDILLIRGFRGVMFSRLSYKFKLADLIFIGLGIFIFFVGIKF